MVCLYFPKIYKSKEIDDKNLKVISLEDLYDEYVTLVLKESSTPVVTFDFT